MKKFKIILAIVINIVIIFLMVFFLHFYVLYKGFTGGEYKPDFHIVKQQYLSFMQRDISKQDTYYNLIHSDEFRPVENKNSKKKPIVVFGCSYAWGSWLEDNQTISYKLGQLTQRPIYNRARMGWGVQQMLYQLQQDEFYKIVPKPEYIIYIFIGGHETRLKTPVCPTFNNCYYIFYKMKNNKLIPKKRTFYTDKFVLQHYLANKYGHFDLMDMYPYFEEAKKIVDKKWGKDVKFVILMYEPMENEELIKKLQNLGYIIINEDEKPIRWDDNTYWYSETDNHPNEKAWDEMVPFLIDRLGINN